MGRPVRRCALLLLLAALLAACGSQPDLSALFESATAALWRGELDRARALSHDGAARAAAEERAEWEWKFRLLQAEILLVEGEPGPAAPLLAPDPPASPAFGWVRAKHAYVTGQHRLLSRDLPGALGALEDARRLAVDAAAADVQMDAEALIGQVLQRSGRGSDGEQVLQELVARARRRGDRYHEAVALVNLGMSRLVRNRFDEALSFFEPALAMTELEPQLVYARALINAGLSYARLGDFARAVDLQERVVASQRQRGHRLYLEQALGELGSTFVLQGDFERAIAPLEEAYRVAASMAGESAQAARDAALWSANLASAHLEQGRWDEAERWNRDAARVNDEANDDARNRPYRALVEARILEGRGQIDRALETYARAATLGRDDPNVQWRVFSRLGWIAHRAGDPRAATRHFEAALDLVERTRGDLLDPDYRLTIQQRLIDLYHQYADVLVSSGDIEGALAVSDSGRARELARRHGLDAPTRGRPEAFRRLARDVDAVLLAYWFGPSGPAVWVITPRRIEFVRLPLAQTGIDRLVAAHHGQLVEALSDPVAGRDTPGDRLYEALVAPVAAKIPAQARVVIVPDGSIATLNFETLPVAGPDRHYWIEDVQVAVAPSLGTLLAAGPGPEAARDRDVLIMGDAVAADPEFPALRYASSEMAAIEKAFGGRAAVYRGERASPAAYREAGPEAFGIVHFTAHAAPNADSPRDSAVILSRAASGYKLYASDVEAVPLSADLVTISACRSAGDRVYAGEGLVGFAWAFLRAGARRVIAGLWDVDDRSTAELMARLYQGIARGHSPAPALRAAKLEMIRSGGALAKPYYWAPFQVFVGAAVEP